MVLCLQLTYVIDIIIIKTSTLGTKVNDKNIT